MGKLSLPPRARGLAFAALLAGLAWDLSRVAFVESDWDEDACIAIGWLLSRGWRLYGDVFSHHMPLDYLPSWAVASLFGGRLAAFRGAMLALWVLVCLAVYRFLGRRGKEEGLRLAPFLFALLSSQWLTYWKGQMMLVESLWGYAVVLLLALLREPLDLPAEKVGRPRAAGTGFLMGVLLSASLTCALPFACLALRLACSPAWRRAWAPLLAGFAGWAALFGLWCARHVSPGEWYAQAVWFNHAVYAPFWGLPADHVFAAFLARTARENLAYFATFWRWTNLEQYFEGLLKLAMLGWLGYHAARRRYWEAAWWAVFLVSLRARSERFAHVAPFHSAPFYLAATLLIAAALARLFSAALRRGGLRLTATAVLGAAVMLAPTVAATSVAAARLALEAGPDSSYEAILDAARRCVPEGERIAAFPSRPRLYVESDRLPAAPGVFYLPWMDAWERQRASTLDGLERHKPLMVLVQDTAIWGVPWTRFGAGIEAFLKQGYLPVLGGAADERAGLQLHVRREEAERFVRCASQPGSGPAVQQ